MAQVKSKCVLPINLLTEGRSAVVVGGGKIAYRKALTLSASGLAVTVIARNFGDFDWNTIEASCIQKEYSKDDLKCVELVVAATDDTILNLRILKDARLVGALCNLVDSGWGEGDFITPAVVRTAGVTLGITTGGANCTLSKRIKNQILESVRFVSDAGSFSFTTSKSNLVLLELLLRRFKSISEYKISSHGDLVVVSGKGVLDCGDWKILELISGGIDDVYY